MYCLLAFPTGRLESRFDRALVAAAALTVLFLYLPTALLVERYPVPAPGVGCVAGCPANAFMISGSEPAFIADVVRPLREVLHHRAVRGGLCAARDEIESSERLKRRALAPVLAVACFRCAAFSGALVGRRIAPRAQLVDLSVWLVTLAVPLTAVAFLVGLLRWWVYIARSTQRLAAKLRGHPTPDRLRRALAEAFDDPALEVVYWLGNGKGYWGDADGHAVDPPSAADGRAITEITDDGRRVAAIVHDAALEDEQAFVDAATSYAVMTLENHRLSAQTSSRARGARVAGAHPGRGGRRAPADRARSARRCAAAARRPADRARARRREDRRRARERGGGGGHLAPAREGRRGCFGGGS